VRCCEGCGEVRYCQICFGDSYHYEYKMHFCEFCTEHYDSSKSSHV
jgi:hypothetical protein